jgi:hypothetical protein
MPPTSILSKPDIEMEVGMNTGTCILLIFLIVVAAFTGLGYVVPELNEKTAELDALNRELISTRAELESTQEALGDEQEAHKSTRSELETSRARLQETEVALQIGLAQNRDLQAALAAEKDARQQVEGNLEQVRHERNELQIRVQELESQGSHTGSMLSGSSPNSAHYGDTAAWLLSLVVLVVSSIGSYRIAWSRRGHLHNGFVVTQPGKQSSSNHQETNSQFVTVRIPRERVTDFSKWLRTGKV